MVIRAAWFSGASLAAMLAVSACGGPPPPPPTVVNLTLRATNDVNPGPAGVGAPVELRVYQLGSPASFNSAEFFQLFDHDDATLKTDSLKHDPYMMAPGQSVTASISPGPTVKTLGFFAAYREYQTKTWRKTWDIPANQTTSLTVTVWRDGIAIPPPEPAKK